MVLPESLVIHGGATSERRTRVEVCSEVMVMGMDHDGSMGYGYLFARERVVWFYFSSSGARTG